MALLKQGVQTTPTRPEHRKTTPAWSLSGVLLGYPASSSPSLAWSAAVEVGIPQLECWEGPTEVIEKVMNNANPVEGPALTEQMCSLRVQARRWKPTPGRTGRRHSDPVFLRNPKTNLWKTEPGHPSAGVFSPRDLLTTSLSLCGTRASTTGNRVLLKLLRKPTELNTSQVPDRRQ